MFLDSAFLTRSLIRLASIRRVYCDSRDERTTQVYEGSGNLPLDGGHVAASVLDIQSTVMTASISNVLPSELDFAILDDIGWQVVGDTKPSVSFDVSSAVVLESQGTVEVTATLSAARSVAVSVPIVVSGVASSDTDVALSTTSLTFAPNQTTATVQINIVDDESAEVTEAVTLNILDSVAANVDDQDAFRLTIFDDDGVDTDSVPRIDLETIGNSISVPGDNQPRAILFRAVANRTLSLSAVGVDQISRTVLLVDRSGNTIGDLTSTGIQSAPLEAGVSYALLFYPRSTARTFDLTVAGGFAAATEPTRTNVLFVADVTGDGFASAGDALRIINQINASPTSSDAYAAAVPSDSFYDVSGDGFITAVDALQVINVLNATDNSSDEPVAPAAFAAGNIDNEDNERLEALADLAIQSLTSVEKIASFD